MNTMTTTEPSFELELQRAIDVHRAGDLDEAAKLYQAILHERPYHAIANHNLGLLAGQRGLYQEALPYLHTALSINPDEGQFWVSYASGLLQAGQAEQALEMVQAAMARGLDNEAARSLEQRAKQALRAQQPDSELSDAESQQLSTLYQSGHYAELEDTARTLLGQHPESAYLWGVLGMALDLQDKDNLSAVERVTELQPADAAAWVVLGNALQKHERRADAIASYQRAIELAPDFASAYNNLGYAQHAADLLVEAEASYRQAVALDPGYAKAYTNLGNVLQAQKKFDAAIACYHKSLEFAPDDNATQIALGDALRLSKQFVQARGCYEKALFADPDNSQIWAKLGETMQLQDQHAASIAPLRKALELLPDETGYQHRLAIGLLTIGDMAEALDLYRKVLQKCEGMPELHLDIAICLTRLGRMEEATFHNREGIRLGATTRLAYVNLSACLMALGRVGEAIEVCKEGLLQHPECTDLRSNILFSMLHHSGSSPQEIHAAHLEYGRWCLPPEVVLPTYEDRDRDPERRLRIGFISGDLRGHAVANFVLPLLEYLCKSPRLDLHAYYNLNRTDQTTLRLKDCFSSWTQVESLSDDDLVKKIAADQIDILIDLAGHTGYNRLPAMARRPAPVQASWIGYPGSTGVQAIDYYITDRYFTPPEMAWQFTEALAHLPAALPFLPAAGSPDVGELPALHKQHFTFGSMNRTSKLSREVIALWSRLLRATPDSRLLIAGIDADASETKLSGWFAEEDISRERLEFRRRMPQSEYLHLHNEIDVCLDPFPYTGGTTTMHALWMGTPVLSPAGATVAGRGSAAILAQVGLHAFIANDADDFVEKGVYVVQHLDMLAAIRANLRQLLEQSPIGQHHMLAVGLEGALRAMWHRWCSGLPRASFEIEYYSEEKSQEENQA